MRLHCLNVVDAAARAPTRLVREWRSFRDGVVPTQDLPCFTPGTENFFVTDIRKNKGIQCRFGMRGVIAEAHYDGGRNMVALLRGEKRYI